MCKGCDNYCETFPGHGYCRLWDMYVKQDDDCDDYK